MDRERKVERGKRKRIEKKRRRRKDKERDDGNKAVYTSSAVVYVWAGGQGQ